MFVRSLDDQRVVLVAGQLPEPLAQDVHATELGQQTVEGLGLDRRGIQLHVVRTARRMTSH
jgi:hypothetical protein